MRNKDSATMSFEHLSLAYHQREPAGKIAVTLTKPLNSPDDLALAYSPGVAGPARKIAANADDSYLYTSRGNLVAVISDGSAVLGLGNIGPYAAKPIMEGKGMLFKKFAGIDVFDLELNAPEADDFINAVKTLEPTFGGINLEDITAPKCFYIEERLRQEMNIPVFHDDQHGTAIVVAAGLVNALKLTQRSWQSARVVICGAGAAAISCGKLLMALGLPAENLLMSDSHGILTSERQGLNPYKQKFVRTTTRTSLAAAMKDADIFIGLSSANIVSPAMLKSMAANPIVFALANPNPEIAPELAHRSRPDVIMATGRSDFPNQVNNVLAFPYIFRGALDVRASEINEEMKLAAVHAIANLAHEETPQEVQEFYQSKTPYRFGAEYLLPKPMDPRVLLHVAPKVAEAAMATGVAKVKIDLGEYKRKLAK
jgi:malate dehydrogenase (oxaloacetate-decarboxylating)(NADP+)